MLKKHSETSRPPVGTPADSIDDSRKTGEATDAADFPTSDESPDPRDQALEENWDDMVPTRGFELTPMVGLGASAGSIQALQQFFSIAKMAVKTAEDHEKVVPNTVYVIPPAKQLTTADGHLRRAENERWHSRKGGSTFYGSGSVSPLRDKSGELLGYVKIMRDLTEAKRTEEELREQMDELKRFNDVVVGREARMIELKKETTLYAPKWAGRRDIPLNSSPEKRRLSPRERI